MKVITRAAVAALVVVAVVAAAAAGASAAAGKGHGWGDNIDWRSYEEAQGGALQKPVMYIIHKTWCGACKALRPQFAGSSEIAELSKSFTMVSLEDDEEPKDSAFSPDGGYIPRILFGDASGKVNADVYNTNGSPKYKYYYSSPTQIVDAMKNAAKVLGGSSGRAEL